ncbi:MAG: CRISPR-associated endonuclease Cas2 [Candidatus Pacebacteria bacterium]|nr:CRISPR-associated endonuclease Cas2 [Candidatus Paceibacterota bacterium]
METDVRSARRKAYLQDAVLGVLAVSGVIAWAMIAPNTLQLLRWVGPNRSRFSERAKSAAGRLVAKGYARFEERDGKKYVRITPAGTLFLDRQMLQMQILKSGQVVKRWDGKWRMVVFDIPERRSGIRKRLRRLMIDIGFIRVQNSVWMYPYDCEDLVALIKAELRVGKDILYAIVDKVENDRWLRSKFRLK